MGIKDLLPFLRKKAPEAFFTARLDLFSGRRIAVDTNNWMIRRYSKIRSALINEMNNVLQEPDPEELHRRWFRNALNFISNLLENDIIPVFVFDGKHPVDKSSTKKKRFEDRQKRKKKIEDSLEQLNSLDPLERETFDTTSIMKDQMNFISLTSRDYEEFRKFLHSLGMIVLHAEGEGEKLCCSLCLEGKVAAVYSGDSDTLAYGCPLIIHDVEFNYRSRETVLQCIRYDKVLTSLELTPEMFVDFCILCGNDYNKNMRGYATCKSYDLIKNYLSIDRLPLKFDLTELRHQRSRELFSYQPSEQICVTPLNFENPIDIEKIQEAFDFVRNNNSPHMLISKLETLCCQEGHPELNLILFPCYQCKPDQLIFYF